MVVELLVSAVAFLIGGYFLSGVDLDDIIQALIVAIVVAVLDFTLGNFLKIVSLGLLSLGIFNWLLNAVLIQIADWLLPKFKVKNFWWALLLAAIVSISASVIKAVVPGI